MIPLKMQFPSPLLIVQVLHAPLLGYSSPTSLTWPHSQHSVSLSRLQHPNNSAVGTNKSQHSHSDARVWRIEEAYQRRPMLRMQRLCISLLSGLVSWSAAMSEVEVYTKEMAPPVTCSRTK